MLRSAGATVAPTGLSPLDQGLTSLRYKHGLPILDMRFAMGSVALTNKPVIWSFVEGELLVGLRDDNHHTLFGFLSRAAIRAMLRQEWLRCEGPYLHVTDAGREAARRDFIGFKPPRPRSNTAVFTTVAPITIPGALRMQHCPSGSIH
jgi:hypothetical protein